MAALFQLLSPSNNWVLFKTIGQDSTQAQNQVLSLRVSLFKQVINLIFLIVKWEYFQPLDEEKRNTYKAVSPAPDTEQALINVNFKHYYQQVEEPKYTLYLLSTDLRTRS